MNTSKQPKDLQDHIDELAVALLETLKVLRETNKQQSKDLVDFESDQYLRGFRE